MKKIKAVVVSCATLLGATAVAILPLIAMGVAGRGMWEALRFGWGLLDRFF